MRPALGDRAAQRGRLLRRAEQVLLPDHLVERHGAQPRGQGTLGAGHGRVSARRRVTGGEELVGHVRGVSLEVAAPEDQVGDRADDEHVADREQPQERARVLRAAERPRGSPRRRSPRRCPPSACAAPTGRAPRTAAPRTRSTRCRCSVSELSASPIWPSSPAARPAPKTMKTAMPLAVVREDRRAEERDRDDDDDRRAPATPGRRAGVARPPVPRRAGDHDRGRVDELDVDDADRPAPPRSAPRAASCGRSGRTTSGCSRPRSASPRTALSVRNDGQRRSRGRASRTSRGRASVAPARVCSRRGRAPR